ncbi:hypothetical protein PHLGIDRAFT_122381 [Phlebiopsis gigantea 11061_1 CR5-6]|uniref:Amino acid permease/ SLC12A domain-containing protein n=1 Tax=Phlebiopsis gigantea (strain 11061_1 CR5-6) TaxID=745531 RepID=A0A0C3NDD5_PHLG1|nr:hypothetical protein PHLGIDRAFT_122381 [Phlebiopsis gigantea 11061_1 CR5-6]
MSTKDEILPYQESVEMSPASQEYDDDALLRKMGYTPSFSREFASISTISFAFSIMGLCSSVATTFNTPLLFGGPSSVTWCWIIGSCLCMTLGASVAEILSAYPTCGGIYGASSRLCPSSHRAIMGWIIGWLTILAIVVGLSSTELGLSNMIWAGVAIGRDGDFTPTAGKSVGLCAALLVVHAFLNCLGTRRLAYMTSSFVFINLGTTILIIVVLLAMTPRSEMHTASYVFGIDGIINNAKGWGNGVAFLFGLLSVEWTMTGYDATGHISEEIRRAAYRTPTAIIVSIIGTGLLGWLLNIVLVLCSGPFEDLPGPSDSAFLQILVLRVGKSGGLFLWALVCLTAFVVCLSCVQANSRAFYAFSRDHGLPDGDYFGHIDPTTKTPIRAIWFSAFLGALPGLLDLASPLALNAVYAATAMAFDLAYLVAVVLRRIYADHPEVQFKPGPFYMGDGWFGWTVNTIAVLWTIFVCIIFCMPNELPVNTQNMNYASVITGGVILLAMVWYYLGAKKRYHGPASNVALSTDTRSLEADVKVQ